MAFERELAAFDREYAAMREQMGCYALLHGDGVVGVFENFEHALELGYSLFGMDPFLVKRILPVEEVRYRRPSEMPRLV